MMKMCVVLSKSGTITPSQSEYITMAEWFKQWVLKEVKNNTYSMSNIMINTLTKLTENYLVFEDINRILQSNFDTISFRAHSEFREFVQSNPKIFGGNWRIVTIDIPEGIPIADIKICKPASHNGCECLVYEIPMPSDNNIRQEG